MADKKTGSVRISGDLFTHIKETADLKNRSLAGQIEYWVMLGIMLEKRSNEDELNAAILEFKSYFKK